MKFRTHTPEPSEEDERQAQESLDALLHSRGYEAPSRLPDAVRSAMLVRTNERIDRAASGRALSLSWAVRVAVPGVVAIVSFFIGLHYYGTPVPREPSTLLPILAGLPAATLDSLMEVHAVAGGPVLAAAGGFFDISGDLAAEYFLQTDRADLVAETLDDRQVEEVIAALNTRAVF